MQRQKTSPDPATLDGTKLWDEILKAIVSAMPSQLFPLFKEVYGREYPKDTPIVLLGTETSSFQENDTEPPGSTLMDIALLVAGTDYYHLECQMKPDSEMVIRMFAYDVRFAITHSKTMDRDTGEIILYFPRSVVIYPEKNDSIPDHLKCRVVFQDSSEHIYTVPTVKIQTYSLQEIKEKHLTLFIPYTILRLRPKIKKGLESSLLQKELTEFVEEAILVLKEEYTEGYLTEREYRRYVRLFRFAADRILRQYSQLREEVHRMTEPLLKVFTDEEEELWDKIEAQKAKLADQEAKLADQEAQLADKDAEIRRLQQLVAQLSSGKNSRA